MLVVCNFDFLSKPHPTCRQPEVRQGGDKKGSPLSLPSFGGGGKDKSDFLVIDKNPRIGKDFRGCQMAVWSGLSGAQLPTESCANILKNAVGAVGNAVGGAANTLSGGLLGGRQGGQQGGQKKTLGFLGK